MFDPTPQLRASELAPQLRIRWCQWKDCRKPALARLCPPSRISPQIVCLVSTGLIHAPPSAHYLFGLFLVCLWPVWSLFRPSLSCSVFFSSVSFSSVSLGLSLVCLARSFYRLSRSVSFSPATVSVRSLSLLQSFLYISLRLRQPVPHSSYGSCHPTLGSLTPLLPTSPCSGLFQSARFSPSYPSLPLCAPRGSRQSLTYISPSRLYPDALFCLT